MKGSVVVKFGPTHAPSDHFQQWVPWWIISSLKCLSLMHFMQISQPFCEERRKPLCQELLELDFWLFIFPIGFYRAKSAPLVWPLLIPASSLWKFISLFYFFFPWKADFCSQKFQPMPLARSLPENLPNLLLLCSASQPGGSLRMLANYLPSWLPWLFFHAN